MKDIHPLEAVIHKTLDGYNDDRDMMNQLLGQAQMASAFADFSRTIGVSKLAFVKENKLYRALKGKRTPNGSEFSGTWTEFCQLLGVSADKVDLDIANLRAFGEQALEAMSRMGIGYRDLAQFRRLPDDSRKALIELSHTGDKVAVLELAEELLAKQEAEKAKVEAALAEAREDLATKDQRAGVREREIDQLQKELRKAKRQADLATPADVEKDLRQHASNIALQVRSAISARGDGVDSLHERAGALIEHGRELGTDHTVFLSGLFREIDHELRALAAELGVDMVSADPEWLRSDAGN